jgi:Beta-ketoacyl synthase, N-terminal domain
MLSCYISAVSVATPGLTNWKDGLDVLAGSRPFVSSPLDKYRPTLLPANECRRATELVRMVFRVCEDLKLPSGLSFAECAGVFASSGGDYPIIDQICRSLCTDERLVSPTQFHNSVHNSAAGYWSIATGSRKASTSISCFDHSFIAGLIEAMSLCQTENIPTIFATYDIKTPDPLNEKRPINIEFGVAFLLTPNSNSLSFAQLTLHHSSGNSVTQCQIAELEQLRLMNPAARSLPLLELLAKQVSGSLFFDCYQQNSVELKVSYGLK